MSNVRWIGFAVWRNWLPEGIPVLEQCREELAVIAEYRASTAT